MAVGRSLGGRASLHTRRCSRLQFSSWDVSFDDSFLASTAPTVAACVRSACSCVLQEMLRPRPAELGAVPKDQDTDEAVSAVTRCATHVCLSTHTTQRRPLADSLASCSWLTCFVLSERLPANPRLLWRCANLSTQPHGWSEPSPETIRNEQARAGHRA